MVAREPQEAHVAKKQTTSEGAPKRAGKKKANAADAQSGDATVQVEGAGDAATDATVAPAADAKGVTLADLSAGYLKHLDETASPGTRMSYGLEMATALDELGAETLLSALTPERVLEFFVSERVTRTKTHVEKAPPTIAKTRRVLRQALVWAQETGLVEKAPVPEGSALPY